MSKPINVAIVGVGNCAKSLVEGVALYSSNDCTDGLAFADIGGYKASDIRFVLAYDIDPRKVNHPLKDAIFAKPNCAMDFNPPKESLQRICSGTVVKRGALYDGVAPHMLSYPKEQSFRVSDGPDLLQGELVRDLQDHKVDVVLIYLPVGSEIAGHFYIEACLKAKVPFVNCIPVFFVSTKEGHEKLVAAGIPAIGDDMRSQLGASVMSQALQELFFNRGMKVLFHKQVNDGGNTDFLNMEDKTRLSSKKISKENVIKSQNEIRGIPVPLNGIFAGPAAYVPYQGDNKVATFRIEATGFGGAPVTFDARLSVQDSPNSAGVVIDAIRYLQVAHELGLVGALRGPSAATQKTPPEQMMIEDAYKECKALANRQLTHSLVSQPTALVRDSSWGDQPLHRSV